MCNTTVVNKTFEEFDVYIGRGSIWGNPFKIGPDGTRAQVVEAYRRYLWDSPNLIDRLDELEDKRLGCFCKPEACHGDVLVKALEWKNARA